MFGTWIKGALFGDKALEKPKRIDTSSHSTAAARQRQALIKKEEQKGKDKK
jgi:hypothetical protein